MVFDYYRIPEDIDETAQQKADITQNSEDIQTNADGIKTNAAVIQTKTTGPTPSIPNSVARFIGTTGTTITSSNVVVNDAGNIGIGTVSPLYQMDVRSVGTAKSQIHLTSNDSDMGGYLASDTDTALFLSGGASYDASVGFVAKAAQAGIIATYLGATSISSNTGLTPGATIVSNEVIRTQNADASPSTNGITTVANSGYVRQIYPVTGVAAPSFTTRSVGTKIVLYPLMTGATADIAIGVEGNTMWFGHIDNNPARLYKWYGGTTEAMRLQGDGRLFVKTGGSTALAAVGGTRFDYFTDANNNVATGETDLYSSTTSAGALANNGDKFTATYQIVCNGAALSSQQMKLYFGGTVIYDSGALAIGAITSNFTFEVTVIRVSATVVRCSVAVSTDFATLFPYSKYTEVTGLTLSNTNILKITGTASGAAAGDNQITAKLGSVSWQPAAI